MASGTPSDVATASRRAIPEAGGATIAPLGRGEPFDIVLSHLVEDYGAARAVDDLSCSVPAGSVTGLLGPNGVGKTNTLRCVVGLVAPTAAGHLRDSHSGQRVKPATGPFGTFPSSCPSCSIQRPYSH
jgi:ABC-type transport system involved in cytochrome bd biosynthesis fused ATPase/permease subunit